MKRLKRISAMLSLAVMMCMMSITAFADEGGGGIDNSVLATGLKKLIEDCTAWGTGIALALTGAVIVYFLIRRAPADEQDKKQWDGRIKTALISGLAATLAVPLIGTIASYFVAG